MTAVLKARDRVISALLYALLLTLVFFIASYLYLVEPFYIVQRFIAATPLSLLVFGGLFIYLRNVALLDRRKRWIKCGKALILICLLFWVQLNGRYAVKEAAFLENCLSTKHELPEDDALKLPSFCACLAEETYDGRNIEWSKLSQKVAFGFYADVDAYLLEMRSLMDPAGKKCLALVDADKKEGSKL